MGYRLVRKAARRVTGRARVLFRTARAFDKEVWCSEQVEASPPEFALRQESLRLLKQPLPSVKPIGNLVGLPLFAHRG
jgi:hypothetical protein